MRIRQQGTRKYNFANCFDFMSPGQSCFFFFLLRRCHILTIYKKCLISISKHAYGVIFPYPSCEDFFLIGSLVIYVNMIITSQLQQVTWLTGYLDLHNSFCQVAICSLDLHNSFHRIAFVRTIYTTRSLGLQFVPSIYSIRSLKLQFVPSIYTTQSGRTGCVNQGNKLQSEGTTCALLI